MAWLGAVLVRSRRPWHPVAASLVTHHAKALARRLSFSVLLAACCLPTPTHVSNVHWMSTFSLLPRMHIAMFQLLCSATTGRLSADYRADQAWPSAPDALMEMSISIRYMRLSYHAPNCIRLILHLYCVGGYKVALPSISPNLFYVVHSCKGLQQ